MSDLEIPIESAPIENVRRAHERVRSIRIEYEVARAAAGVPTWQSIQKSLMLRARYTEAIDEFLLS